MDIISRIIFWMDMRKSNNDIYYHIAKTILLYSDDIPTMRIEELANLCYTSPATISRFCRRLSFSNFIELKQGFQNENDLRNKEVTFTPADMDALAADFSFLAEKTLPVSIDALTQTYEALDMDIINTVTKILLQAKHIAIFGTHYSQLVARDCQHKFIRLRKFATAFSDTTNQWEDAKDLTVKDAAIFISVSGRSRALRSIAEIIKELKAPIIVITSNLQNPLALLADYVLPIGGRESQFTKSSMSGRIASMAVVDLLYTALAYQQQKA